MTSNQAHNQAQEPIVTDGGNKVSPPYLAYVGINQASRLVGKGKVQIYRDIEAGKLSWNIGADGKKTLQVADLDRVYKLTSQGDTGSKTGNENREILGTNEAVTSHNSLETAIEIARLQERVAAKDEALREAREQIADLKQNRDKLIEQTNRLTMLLSAPPAPDPEPTAPPEPIAEAVTSEPPAARLSWFQRLFK